MRKAKRIAEQNAAEPPVQYPPYGHPHAGPNLDEGPMMYNNMAVPAAVYNPNMYYQPSMRQQPAGNDQMNFNIPTQLFQNPAMANMALQYGQSLVGQGKDVIDRELSKYVSTSRLKYYFSVDTAYVMKKLLLILFPFTHQVSLFHYALYSYNLNFIYLTLCEIRTGLLSITQKSQFNLVMKSMLPTCTSP